MPKVSLEYILPADLLFLFVALVSYFTNSLFILLIQTQSCCFSKQCCTTRLFILDPCWVNSIRLYSWTLYFIKKRLPYTCGSSNEYGCVIIVLLFGNGIFFEITFYWVQNLHFCNFSFFAVGQTMLLQIYKQIKGSCQIPSNECWDFVYQTAEKSYLALLEF